MHIIGMMAETFIHPGTGQAMGAIDLPVARERASGLPYVAGSSMKGAYRQAVVDGALKIADKEKDTFLTAAFGAAGTDASAGGVLFSDARLLLLPVRSLTTSYAWLTCPMLLGRLARDLARSGRPAGQGGALTVDKGTMLVSGNGAFTVEQGHYLEDRVLTASAFGERESPVAWLAEAVHFSGLEDALEQRIAVVSDEDFLWFCSYGLHVQARNALDQDTKISTALWYEELLPPDVVFYTLLADRTPTPLARRLADGLDYLQVGGNETLGQGWFRLFRKTEVGDAGDQ